MMVSHFQHLLLPPIRKEQLQRQISAQSAISPVVESNLVRWQNVTME